MLTVDPRHDSVHLSLRTDVRSRIEVEGVTPDHLASLSEGEIAALPVWVGSRTAQLGDFFTVRGGRSADVRVEGDLAHVDGLGAGMSGGALVVDGRAGPRLGAGMRGGSIEVLGSTGDEAGLAMAGGLLRIRGDAGDRLAAAVPGASKGMTGGLVIVGGSAGSHAAAHVRRGLVVVAGDAGGCAAEAMIAGTILVLGRTGPWAGRGNKRGSLIACGGIAIPETYQYACTYAPAYVRLLLTWLRRHHGVAIPDRALEGSYRRYCGDAGVPGKGEILQLEG